MAWGFSNLESLNKYVESSDFVVEQKNVIQTSRPVTINAGANISGEFNVAKAGYKAIAPVGFYRNSNVANLVWNYMSTPTTYRYCLANPSSNAIVVREFRIFILYVKEY